MNKESLIRQLKEILPIMKQVGESMDEVDGLDLRIRSLNIKLNQPSKGIFKYAAIGFGAGYLFFGVGLGAIMYAMPFLLNTRTLGFTGMAGMVIGTIAGIKIGQSKASLEKKEIQEQIKKFTKQKNEAEQEWITLLSPHWEKVKSIVPETYASPLFVEMAYNYLVSGRADTMKECINLFEEEQHRWQMQKDMRDMAQQYQSEMENMHNTIAQLERRVAIAEYEARVSQYDRW